MSALEVVVLGVGDTFSARHVTSAVVLRHRGFQLALDCPDRYRGVLAAAQARSGRELSLGDIDHVLLTHVHGDHMNGLEGVAFWKHFVERKRLHLVCAPEVQRTLWSERLAGPMARLWTGSAFRELGFDDYFEHQPLDWDRPVDVGPFRVRSYMTKHHVPTSAVLVEVDGVRFGYSADTAFDPGLIQFFESADLIVHETNYGPAHTPYESLAALPPEIRSRMRLIHYSDEFDVEASNIAVLREGEVLDVADAGRPPAQVLNRRRGWLDRAAEGVRLLRRR